MKRLVLLLLLLPTLALAQTRVYVDTTSQFTSATGHALNGTYQCGPSGSIQQCNLTPTQGTFAGLPTCNSANNGLGFFCSDCNSGATCTSGGSGTFAICSNGTWTCGATGGGSVTSVGLSLPGIFSVSGSPVTSSGTLTATALGTSGGIPYFSSAAALSSTGILTANNPVIGGGAGVAPTSGARQGNTTTFATTSGAYTLGDCLKVDLNGNFIDAGAACGTSSISGLTTNTLTKATSGTTIGNSAVTEVSSILNTNETIDSNSNPYSIDCPNDSAGTTINTIVKRTAAGKCATIGVGDTNAGYVGIVVSGAGTTGTAVIAIAGPTNCAFDGTTVAGDFVISSTTSGGKCHDGGATRPTGVNVFGTINSANTGVGTYQFDFNEPDVQGGTASNTFTGTVGNTIIPRGTGGSTLGNSSLTDNGVTVSTTESLSIGGITINGKYSFNSTAWPAVSSSGNIAATTTGEDCTSGASAITRTLPAATGSHRMVTLVKVDSGAGTCVFGRTGSDALNGGTTRTLSAQFKRDACYDQASAQWICSGDGT